MKTKTIIQKLVPLDLSLIHFSESITLPFSRFAIFVIYFWFGALKVLGQSPATPLVHKLFDMTMPAGISFDHFVILFGLFEMLIGILFLFKRATRTVIGLLTLHLIATALPLLLLPHDVWTHWFVPTMEGQYIIKNLLIVAAALEIASSLKPLQTLAQSETEK